MHCSDTIYVILLLVVVIVWIKKQARVRCVKMRNENAGGLQCSWWRPRFDCASALLEYLPPSLPPSSLTTPAQWVRATPGTISLPRPSLSSCDRGLVCVERAATTNFPQLQLKLRVFSGVSIVTPSNWEHYT